VVGAATGPAPLVPAEVARGAREMRQCCRVVAVCRAALRASAAAAMTDILRVMIDLTESASVVVRCGSLG